MNIDDYISKTHKAFIAIEYPISEDAFVSFRVTDFPKQVEDEIVTELKKFVNRLEEIIVSQES